MAPNKRSRKKLPAQKRRDPPKPKVRLQIYRDPSTQNARVALLGPLFEEDWQNRLTLAAANTALEILGKSPGLEEAAALGEKLVHSLSQFLTGILSADSGLACHEGCDHCCYQIVGTTWPEILLVQEYLRSVPEPKRSELQERVLGAAERAAGVPPPERFSPEHPCPFLGTGGRCEIYAVRPLACRGVHALDAETCREILRDPERRQEFLKTGNGSPSYREPGRAVHSLSAGLQLCLSELYALDMRPLDFALSFARLIVEPALSAAWLRGERTPDEIRAGHGSTSPERYAQTGEISPHRTQ